MRKRTDPNEVFLFETHAEMVLYDKHQKEKCRTKISLSDVDSIQVCKWYYTEWGYTRGHLPDGKQVFLHRVLLPPEKGSFVDHINQDKLDNRRENLRLCSKAQNSMNRVPQSNSSTGISGVSFDKKRSKYKAHIKVKGKQLWLGHFVELTDAVIARKEAEQLYFGDFACS